LHAVQSENANPEASSLHPPLEHADKQWHWARHEGDNKWFVFEARDGRLWNGPGHMSAEYACAVGWRYFAPAYPPGEIPQPPKKAKAEQIGEMSEAGMETALAARRNAGQPAEAGMNESPKTVVNEQAEDDGLWFVPQTITEDYLQRALRRLHEAVEGKSQEQCAMEALK
jgi:hypothetical protein